MKKEYRITEGTLPAYVGGKVTVMDAADGIDLLLVQDTNKAEYESFCAALKADGYSVYVTRILNGNIYTTFTKDADFVHTHFAPSNNTVKVTMGDVADLPVRKQDAIIKYAKQNAENLISGLISPFVNQLEEDYTISFDWEAK